MRDIFSPASLPESFFARKARAIKHLRREEDRGQRDTEARPLGGGREEFGRQGGRGGEEDEIDRAAKSTVANFGGVERRKGGREGERGAGTGDG